jgi:nitroreductase
MDAYLAIASKRDQRDYAERDIPPDVQERILDAGRIAGSSQNRQPWRFLVLESPELRERVAETVYAPGNLRRARLAVVIVTPGGRNPFDAGRAAQNMMLAAWNEGVTSCPNGMPDADKTAALLPIEGEEKPLNILSFGFPAQERDPESRPAEEWIARAKRKPRDAVVRRL